MEPLEYCDRWVEKYTNIAPGERGYRAACIRELAKATGLKERSIDNNWGEDFKKRPEWVLTGLRNADLVNQAREIFRSDNFPRS